MKAQAISLLKTALRSAGLIAFLMQASAPAADASSDAAQANNPLANFTALNLQNYYIGELTAPDEDANQFWLRYAQPFSIGKTNWLFRGSLPVNSFPVAPNRESKTGLGDLNAFAAYLIDTGNPAVSFGIGPQLTVPTATENQLGSEKWSAGFANVLFNAKSPKFQYGYLLTWQASFAGADDRESVNSGAFQPFAFYQLGKGGLSALSADLGLQLSARHLQRAAGRGHRAGHPEGQDGIQRLHRAPGLCRRQGGGLAQVAGVHRLQYAVQGLTETLVWPYPGRTGAMQMFHVA